MSKVEMPKGFLERLTHCYGLASRFTRETEELADYYIHRRTAAFLVALMGAIDAPWLFTPNRITFLSLVCGASSAYYVYQSYVTDSRDLLLKAAFLELLSITFDCCDGQLARMYGSGSLVGRVLDGVCDMCVALSHGFVWTYILVSNKTVDLYLGVGLLACAIVTFQQQAMMFDRVKNIFCLKTSPKKDKAVVGLEEADLIKKEMKQAWETHSYGSYALLLWYENQYLAVQNKVANKSIDATLHEADTADLDPEDYRAKWSSTMRLVSWCGTGTHAFLFYALIFAAYYLDDISVLVSWFFFNNVLLTGCWFVCWDRVKRM